VYIARNVEVSGASSTMHPGRALGTHWTKTREQLLNHERGAYCNSK